MVKKKNKNLEILCILDRSGSMASLQNDAIGGFNQFIEGHRNTPNAFVTLALFDDKYSLIYDRVPISEVKPLTKEEYSPRGGTALNDAIGTTLSRFKTLKTEGKVSNAIVCILTDGEENRSVEYSYDSIKKLITECEKDFGWNVTYLAANQDAFTVGQRYGLLGNNIANIAASGKGMYDAFNAMDSRTRSYSSNVSRGIINNDYESLQNLVNKA